MIWEQQVMLLYEIRLEKENIRRERVCPFIMARIFKRFQINSLLSRNEASV